MGKIEMGRGRKVPRAIMGLTANEGFHDCSLRGSLLLVNDAMKVGMEKR